MFDSGTFNWFQPSTEYGLPIIEREGSMKGNKILVVDDDQDLLEAVKELLESEGYEVLPRISADQIKQDIDSFDPSLILLDVRLPGQQGDQVAFQLKHDSQLRHVPIILMSAQAGLPQKQFTSGADAYLSKPFDFEETLELIDAFLNA